MVVAVGGDGTVNEILQVLAIHKTGLAIIPTGSGNGLARHCAIPLQIDKAIQLINQGKFMHIDVGKANDVFFISNAGVGFDAIVCNAIKQATSRGLKMYIQMVIQHYFSYRPDTYLIEADGMKIEQKAFFLNVANGKEFGYGFEIAPEATLQDGYLDMVLVKRINLFTGFQFVMDGWRKNLGRNKNCICLKAKKIKIEGMHLHYFQTDGDANSAQGKCNIEIYENALKIWVPSHIKNL